jgi:hypothetical protein
LARQSSEETTVKDHILRRLSGDKAEAVLAEGRDMNARFQHAAKELKLKSVYLLNKQQRMCVFSFFLPDMSLIEALDVWFSTKYFLYTFFMLPSMAHTGVERRRCVEKTQPFTNVSGSKTTICVTT